MFYVYVLRDERGEHYIGYSTDLKARVASHNRNQNRSTRGRTWSLIYYEAYSTDKAAKDRERILKHDGRTRRALMERLLRHHE